MSGGGAAPRVRFAPSPTGSLHLGNARTALFNWLVARQAGGRFILRIEDTDVERGQAGSEETILEDLRWLALDWDEGPGAGGAAGPYRQSERGERYRAAADELVASGTAFRCFCDEATLAAERERRLAAGGAPHYAGPCAGIGAAESARRASAGEPFAVRFAAERAAAGAPSVTFVDRLRGQVEFPVAELGDTVILRSDGRPTYNFAVVVDDAAMRIDLVLRGDDHLSNTPRQVLMYRALGRTPPEFAHLPLVRGSDGSRLSKRHGATSVGEYRRAGYPAAGIVNYLALLGWAPRDERAVLDRQELVREFDLDRIVRSPATFDPAKLGWICAQHIQRRPASDLAAAVASRLAESGALAPSLPDGATPWLSALAELLRPYLSHEAQIPLRAAPVFHAGGEPRSDDARRAIESAEARGVISRLAALAEAAPPADVESWQGLKRRLREESGVAGKALFQPLRVAITGETSGPELDGLVPLIEQGRRLFPGRVAGVAERARRTLEWVETT